VRDLRLGKFAVLVGVNLLRAGRDLPKVSLVPIHDADKEGFLRSETSLIQTCGRASRNLNGRVLMFADRVTESMRKAIQETQRRRAVQMEYNKEHGITPEGIIKSITDVLSSIYEKDYYEVPIDELEGTHLKPKQRSKIVKRLKKEIVEAAKKWDFEKAKDLRDRLLKIEQMELTL